MDLKDLELVLRGEEHNNAVLELLIKILSMQQATASVMIEIFSKSEEEADEAMDLLNSEYTKYAKETIISLIERRGHMDFSDLFENK